MGKALKNIMKMQNRALRLVLCKKYNSAHTDYLYKATKTLKTEDLYLIELTKFYNNLSLKSLPNFFLSMNLNRNADIHNYPDTRNSHNLHRTHSHKKSLLTELPLLTNIIPECIKIRIDHPNHNYGTKFIGLVYKKFILDSYSSTQFCTSPLCYPCSQRNS